VEAENRVLLVEDGAPLRRSLENFLGWAGYAYDSCSTAREALKLIQEFHHDIVIVEYHLPDADGTALLERLKWIVPNAVAIVIAEYDFQVVASELVRVNVRSFLKKPFDLVELESALSSARTQAGVAAESIEWKRESGLHGMPAFISK
jgi:DNA-binding NtrC family response regulator